MRIFLAVLVLIFSLQSITKADDISEFEIEGISIGDSLLDYYSEEEIKKEETDSFVQKNKFIINGFYKHPSFEIYDRVQFIYKKNDKKYIIHSLSGNVFYRKNIEKCYSKKNEIVKELTDFLKGSAKKLDVGTKSHEADKSGKSKSTIVEFWFDNGDLARVICTDWSKKLEEENYWDDLAVILNSKEYADFLMYEAYK